MAEVVKLETNVPVQVAFKYLTGKDCAGGFKGPQKMFTFVDGRIIFLNLMEAQQVENQLAAQQIRACEDVDLSKASLWEGNKRGVGMVVKRVNPPVPPTNGNGNGANGVHPPAPPVAPITKPPQASQPVDGQHANGSAPAAPAHNNTLADALIDAVKAVIATRQYAAAVGFILPEDLSWEDLRAMAATTLINASRNGGLR